MYIGKPGDSVRGCGGAAVFELRVLPLVVAGLGVVVADPEQIDGVGPVLRQGKGHGIAPVKQHAGHVRSVEIRVIKRFVKNVDNALELLPLAVAVQVILQAPVVVVADILPPEILLDAAVFHVVGPQHQGIVLHGIGLVINKHIARIVPKVGQRKGRPAVNQMVAVAFIGRHRFVECVVKGDILLDLCIFALKAVVVRPQAFFHGERGDVQAQAQGRRQDKRQKFALFHFAFPLLILNRAVRCRPDKCPRGWGEPSPGVFPVETNKRAVQVCRIPAQPDTAHNPIKEFPCKTRKITL